MLTCKYSFSSVVLRVFLLYIQVVVSISFFHYSELFRCSDVSVSPLSFSHFVECSQQSGQCAVHNHLIRDTAVQRCKIQAPSNSQGA